MSRDLQQQRDNSAESQMGADVDVDAEHKPEVSRRSSNASLRQVQMARGGGGGNAEQVHAAAERGTQGPGQPLPHLDQVQRLFGRHDVSSIRAHMGPQAENASRQMGAEAYATGDHVAFAGQPDLHTVAHEAAHVVQQKQGVNVSGGVGASGDKYEKQADAIADQVVAGQSVEHMLGPATGGAAPAGQTVQQKAGDKTQDPKAAHDKADRKSFDSSESALKHLAVELKAWMPKLNELAGADTGGDDAGGHAMEAISAIFERANTDISRVHDLLTVTAPKERNLLAGDVKMVQWAFNRFSIPATKASHFVTKHGGEAPKLDEMKTKVDSFTTQLGFEANELPLTETAIEGDEKSMSKAMIDDQIIALGAAVESVKSGNDSDASRITGHTRYLDNISKEHVAELKSHKNELKKIFASLVEIEQAKPSIAGNLAEAHNHLISLTK